MAPAPEPRPKTAWSQTLNGGRCCHRPPLSQLHGPPAGAASRWAGGSRAGLSPFDPLGGSGATPKRRPFPSGLRIGSVSPLSFSGPSGEAAEAAAPSGFSLRRLRGEPRLRFPGALPRSGRSPSASGPPSIPRRAAVSREPAVHTRQACCRAGRGWKWRPKPPLPLPLRKVRRSAKAEARLVPSLFRNLQRSRSRHFPSRSAAPIRSQSFFSGAATDSSLEVVPASACASARPASSLPSAAALPVAPPSRGMNLLGFQRLLPSWLRVVSSASPVRLQE
jgi:hypothetical protein